MLFISRFGADVWNETRLKALICWCDLKCNLFTVNRYGTEILDGVLSFYVMELKDLKGFNLVNRHQEMCPGGSPKHHKMSFYPWKSKWIIYWKLFSEHFVVFAAVYFCSSFFLVYTFFIFKEISPRWHIVVLVRLNNRQSASLEWRQREPYFKTANFSKACEQQIYDGMPFLGKDL